MSKAAVLSKAVVVLLLNHCVLLLFLFVGGSVFYYSKLCVPLVINYVDLELNEKIE